MDFSAHDDIEAPIDYVFDQVTDLASFERSIMRRGGDVERVSGGDMAAIGTKWDVKFRFRGKDRVVRAEIVTLEQPNTMGLDVTSPNVDGKMVAELVALSRARTRLTVKVNITPKTLPAKLVFQTMRFGRQRAAGKFETMVSTFAKDVETGYRS